MIQFALLVPRLGVVEDLVMRVIVDGGLPPAPVRLVVGSLPGPWTGGLVPPVLLVLLLLLLLLCPGVVHPPHVQLPSGGHLGLDVGVLEDGDPGDGAGPGPLLVVLVPARVIVVLTGLVGPPLFS